MRKFLASILGALVLLGLVAGPAAAVNADVAVSSSSDSGTYLVAKDYAGSGSQWRIYPGGSSLNNTVDAVYIPHCMIAYHYYNGKWVETRRGAVTLNVGGVYKHLFYVYWLPPREC